MQLIKESHRLSEGWSELERTDYQMKNRKTKKCAHIPCLCDVPNGEEYCGDACREAGSEDVEIACQCDHLACPLTARRFVPRSVADLAG